MFIHSIAYASMGSSQSSTICSLTVNLCNSLSFDIDVRDIRLLFLHRFKKSAQTGVTADVKAKERLATLQRDSRPLLYRYHEVLSLQF